MLIRSGLEILSSLPKLYWKDHALPGTEWIKFTKKKDPPKDKLWISLEEEEDFSPLIALPGHKNLGLGRHWHFFSAIFWGLNGIVYYVLLFTSDQWNRLVPTSFDVISGAIQTAFTYATFHFPPPGNPYNPLQQLMYFGVVFILGPFMVTTGAAMSPSIDARFPKYPKIFGGRQAARSLHFLGTVAFILFIIIHVSMVLIEKFPDNVGRIILGYPVNFVTAVGLFALYVVVIAIIHVWATRSSLKNPRLVQIRLDYFVSKVKDIFFEKMTSKQEFTRSETSQFFRINGYPPDTNEFQNLNKNNFKDWRLKVYGNVETPAEFSMSDLVNMQNKQTQITEHFCIQGWTAIGEWGGVPMNYVFEKCKPTSKARYVVFYSYQYMDNSQYYEVLDLEIARHPQTLLAYEMNGEKLDLGHGAPLRLRVETQLGYKMVKWLKAIEFVEDYKHIGLGQGGNREDHRFYARRAGI